MKSKKSETSIVVLTVRPHTPLSILSALVPGMTSHQTLNMTASSERAAIPMLAAAHRICGFVPQTIVQYTALCDRPFASLWLAKAYVVPAGRVMYAVRFAAQDFCAKVMCLGLPYRHCI